MNTSSLSRPFIAPSPLLISLSFIAAVVLSGGCATRGYERAAKTSDALTSAAYEVDSTRGQLSATLDALHTLMTQPATELQPAFERYRDAIGSLEKTVGQLRKKTDDMEKQGQQYFNMWDLRLSQIRNEDIRARSAERQREVTEQFADIRLRYENARQQMEPLMSNLRDIQAALSIDLTPAGVEIARQFAQQADANAITARQSLDQLAEALRNMSSALYPAPSPDSTTQSTQLAPADSARTSDRLGAC